jgi:hypothetical protein
VLAVVGILAARHRMPYLLAAAGATALLLSYVLTLDWSNPRYLMPTYALLALPAGGALVSAVRWRHAMAVVIAIGLVLHVGAQAMTYQRVVKNQLQFQRILLEEEKTLEGKLGVSSPCVIFGPGSVQLSFVTHCRPLLDQSVPALSDARVQDALASGEQVVVIEQAPTGGLPPVDGWRAAQLKSSGQTWAYVSER